MMNNNNMNIKHSIKGTQTNWIEMQTDTFVNWININLSPRGMSIKNIETAFEDGTKLVNLYEVISKRSIGKYVKKPRFHTQKMENISLVLRELELDGMKSISIDTDHIIKGNFKMILGLIWQLILRYQVGGSEDDSIKIVVKKLLLIWLQNIIPDQNIRNLTSDWNSGIALCNLIDVLQPGLCPEYRTMETNTPSENVAKGLKLAEQAFGIPQIISAEYMASPDVDDLSMTTYLSYFTQDGGIGQQWTLNLIHNWNPQIEVTNFNADWTNGLVVSKLVNTFVSDSVDENLLGDDNVNNCRMAMGAAREKCDVQQIIRPEEMSNPKIPELAIMAYVAQFIKLHESGFFWASGSGLIEAMVGKENVFHVNFPKSVTMDFLYAVVLNPKNQTLKITLEDVHQNLRKFTYTPEEAGNYTVNISYEGKHISRSPYLVHVLPQQGSDAKADESDPSSCLYAEVNERIGISVDTRNSGKGKLTATTTGPNEISIPTKVFREEDGANTVSFTPPEIGKYTTSVHWNNKPIAQSPFLVYVCDPSKCIAKQPIVSVGVVREKCDIQMLTSGAGPGFVTSYAEYIGGNIAVDVNVTEMKTEHFSCSFIPSVPGDYVLHVNYSDCPINGSPFKIAVKQRWAVGVVIDRTTEREALVPCGFYVGVQDRDGIGELKCFVSGPLGEHVQSDIAESDKSDESDEECRFEIYFTPLVEGEHTIEIYYRDERDHNSPYMVHVNSPTPETEDMQLYAEVNEKIGISVDTRKSGNGMLTADTVGPVDTPVTTKIVKEKDGRNTVSFTPGEVGFLETNVYWNGKAIKGSPFTVCVIDPSKCILREPLTEGQVNKDLVFEVVTLGAGPGTLTSYVEYEGMVLEVSVAEGDDGWYFCTFRPVVAGNYVLHVKYNESTTRPYPFTVYDPNNVSVSIDPNLDAQTNGTYNFDIHIADGFASETLTCVIKGPDGEDVASEISTDSDGKVSSVSFCPCLDGCYTVSVAYGGVLVEHCPYIVNAITPVPIPDASQVETSGESLNGGYVNELCRVEVDARNAGSGELIANVEGASDVIVGIVEENDGVFNLSYTPPLSGEYTLNIKWDNVHVPRSPFRIVINERTYATKVLLDGNGLKEGTVGQPTLFKVDGRNAGPGHLSCRCRAPSGNKTNVIIRHNEDGTYTVDLNVTESGLHKLYINWEQEVVPGSPFLVKVMQLPDAKKIWCYGPGLKSGIADTFQGIFFVDTTGGGPGALKVRVNGPKECFKVEMSRDRLKSRVINVKYNPTVPGIYTANVFWLDEHVKGSPYEIFIAAKASHLEKWSLLREEIENKDSLLT